MSIGYRLSDLRIGLGPATPATNPNIPGYLPPLPWVASTVYPALSVVINNGYVFRTVAGGTATTGGGPSQSNLTDNTVTWVAVGPLNPLYAQDAAATFPVGTVARINSPDYGDGEAIYVKFTGTVAAGDCVVYDTFAQTGVIQPTTFLAGPVGISMAIQASGTFGWLLIRGVCDYASVTDAVAVGGLGNSGATAGQFIAATTSNTVSGAWLRVVTPGATTFGIVEVRYPAQGKHTSVA
jgi:hypothetical protein